MSNEYIRDVSGRLRDNPLNDIGTLYESFEYSENERYMGTSVQSISKDPRPLFDLEYMYTAQPITQIDTFYNNLYRQTVERLRMQTETWYDYLSSNTVPYFLEGETIECHDQAHYLEDDEENGGKVITAGTFTLGDHIIQIPTTDSAGNVYREMVYKVNWIPFVNNLHQRFWYNKTIHIITNEGDTINDLALKYEFAASAALNASNLRDEDEGNPITITTPLEQGVDIDTCIAATQLNLTKRNLLKPFLCFLNGRPISWERVMFAADQLDTYILFNLTNEGYSEIPLENVDLQALFFPFAVTYVSHGSPTPERFEGVSPIFQFWTKYPSISRINKNPGAQNFRIYAEDPGIFFKDYTLSWDDIIKGSRSRNKFHFNFTLKEDGMDYRHKIKKWNILPIYDYDTTNSYHRFLAKDVYDDMNVKWHAFNHLNISVKNPDYWEDRGKPDKLTFRVFYNRNVKYSQDNVLRIMNHIKLDEDFQDYMNSLEGNIKVFLDAIYEMMEDSTKDYGFVTKIYHFDNMEEGSTPTDEFIYYTNLSTRTALHELADEMFAGDSKAVKETMKGVIDDAYIENYSDSWEHEGPLDEWCLRKNLHEMFNWGGNKDFILPDMSLLDEVFDFVYYDSQVYYQNLTNEGTDYIFSYDPDKLESSITRPVYSYTRTNAEVYAMVTADPEDETHHYIDIPRGGCDYRDTYLMLFKNGELYEKYYTIEYTDSLRVHIDCIKGTDVKDTGDDVWEFVWFRNVNNEVVETTFTHKDKFVNGYNTRNNSVDTILGINFIGCNTSIFDPEDVIVLVNKMPDEDEWNQRIAENDPEFTNVRYPIYYTVYSFRGDKKYDGSDHKWASYTYTADPMINGVHRITKQGGGDYFIVPKNLNVNPSTETGNTENTNSDTSQMAGIDQYAFAGANANYISFAGTKAEWNKVAKDPTWCKYMNIGNINTNGGVHCTDGNVSLPTD